MRLSKENDRVKKKKKSLEKCTMKKKNEQFISRI